MNTPNKLTVIRMILVPVFMVLMMFENKACQYCGLTVFIIASVTDWLDGYIARKHNLITTFGKFMDPLADKMLTTAALLILLEKGIISSWVLLIVLGREFLVAGIRLAAVGEGNVIAASMWGKAKTVAQMVAIIVSIILINVPFAYSNTIINILIWISTILTLVSGFDYLIKNKEFIKTK